MTVVGSVRDDDYWPEFGTLVVRDSGDGWAADEDGEPTSIGTIARGGSGLLRAMAGDGPLEVLVQVHDGPVGEVSDVWEDVVEVPYRSGSGVIGLSDVTSPAWVQEALSLGQPGNFRVRVVHHELGVPADIDDESPTDRWQLDFWPVDDVQAPRWIRRSSSPVPVAGDDGWSAVVNYQVMEPISCVWLAKERDDGVTAAELAAWGAAHSRPEDWLDRDLLLGTHELELPIADIALQVGQPAPTTPRMLLPVFVALGYLTFDGHNYLHNPARPLPQEVLQVPAKTLAHLEAVQDVNRYEAFATDLTSVVSIAGRQTISALAERTLASEPEVRGAVKYAVRRGYLTVDDDSTVTPAGS
ncbi:hypothetical protein ACFVWG_20125 [Kribbella sp. NPDC058245]|uniref:hypothetical protein n=1 Tax=Kribbella sp. NPDC058245 TaxID=3346399 RepID=UPI0036EC6F6E